MRRLLKLRRHARHQARRHQKSVEWRMTVVNRFERAKFHGLKVCLSRATIGEVYNHARMFEVIVTCRNRKPLLLPLRSLVTITSHINTVSEEEYHVRVLAPLAQRWARERKPVRHPKWRPR